MNERKDHISALNEQTSYQNNQTSEHIIAVSVNSSKQNDEGREQSIQISEQNNQTSSELNTVALSVNLGLNSQKIIQLVPLKQKIGLSLHTYIQ